MLTKTATALKDRLQTRKQRNAEKKLYVRNPFRELYFLITML